MTHARPALPMVLDTRIGFFVTFFAHCASVWASRVRKAGRVFITFAILLTILCGLAHAATFTFALPSASQHGTELNGAIITDPAKDTAAGLDSVQVAFAKTSETIGVNVTTSNWKSSTGGIVVKCRSEKTATGYTFDFTITNGWTHRLERIDFRLPEIGTAADPDNKIETPFRGGSTIPWATDWAKGQGNTGNWPGTAYSPLVTLWNDRTKDTLAITWFNRSLVPTCLYWFSGGGNAFNPFLRVNPKLGPGETLTITADYRIMTGGPVAHQKYYRQYRLAPFMKELGIPEAIGNLGDGPIMMTATGADQLVASVNKAGAAGASAYIQWPGPDGQDYYNPFPQDEAWWDSLALPRATDIPVGVLINPFISPRVPTDKAFVGHANDVQWTNVSQDLGASDVRWAMTRLRDELVQRHVSIAFWDMGGEPVGMQGHAWLKLLANWKQAGIAIMPETSCDVSAWTTGLWMEFPYSWSDYSLPRVVTPQADLAAHTNYFDVRNGIDWKQDAKAKGVRPIQDVAEVNK